MRTTFAPTYHVIGKTPYFGPEPMRTALSTDPNFDPPRVDPEFAEYLPLRRGRDEAELTALLIRQGCREPVLVWDEENTVVDGHRRSAICAAHNIPYKVEYHSFASRDEVKEWMRHNQLYGKRNLTDTERSYLIGKEHESADTATVAKKNRVSKRKVQKDDKFAKAVDAHEAVSPGAKKKILAGGMSKTAVLKTAPVLCERCIRIGRPVANCPACERERAKKPTKKKPAADLFSGIGNTHATVRIGFKNAEPEPVVDPFEELKALVTNLAGKMTAFMTAEGEVAARLCEYFTWCGLLDYHKGTPKFIPLAGVRMLVDLAGSKGPRQKQAEVFEAYQKACGAVAWVPPATKFRREQQRKK